MEPIRITFLGTGDAIPTKKRNHTSILLSYKNENILIDCGEGTQRQFKFAKLSPSKLTKILITHWHGDHTLGLLGLLETLIMQQHKKEIQICGPKGTHRYMDILSQFLGPYNKIAKLNLKIKEVEGKFIDEKDFFIEAMPMSHGIPTNAYSFVIKDKLRLDKNKIKKLKLPNSPELAELSQGKDVIINTKKISPKDVAYSEKGRKATFILDTKINENMVKIAKDADILISESSFAERDKKFAEEYNHLTSKQAATIAKKAKVKQLILTHISQRYENNTSIILDEAKSIFKSVKIAKDFDKVEI
jgi:ribonuclease Z